MRTVSHLLKRTVRSLSFCAVVCLYIAGSGCTGSARVSVVPFSFKKLVDADPLITRFDPTECYYWTDERGRLCIATSFERVPLVNPFAKRSMVFSMVLDAPPEGPGRNYRATRRTVRMIARNGPNHGRWASLAGIVTVWRTGPSTLHGRFRVFAKHQIFHIAMGWYGRSRALVFGEFRATRNETAGRRILEQSEANGMERFDSASVPKDPKPAATKP